MRETFEWIAATEPADTGEREKRVGQSLLLAAMALLVWWLLSKRRRPVTPVS
jgi:hypothetical protein